MTAIAQLIEQTKTAPTTVEFSQVISLIDEHYTFTETKFTNGETTNEAGSNNGSCKIFAFAQLNGLSKEETLALFGDYYRIDVLQHPEAQDHANIRNFMKSGWKGIQFEGSALHLR